MHPRIVPTNAPKKIETRAEFSFEAPRTSPFFDPRADLELPSVLIADDDPNIAPLVKAALKPYRIYSEVVLHGEEAFTRIRQRTYDLVILDLEMGDMHGFDILRLLREQSRSARVRVLILTGNSSHEALARSFGYGADEFMTKPFDIEELGIRAFRLIRPPRQ